MKDKKRILEKHFNFENLLGDLSAKLVNFPLESIDRAINEGIKMLAEFFNADRCHIGLNLGGYYMLQRVYTVGNGV